MNSMTYKGYFAKISFDERDNIFWGKVVGIKDSITFEGETVAQLTEDLYGRGVLSAKLYDSLTESEESVFEGE